MVGAGQHEGRQGELAESYILILRQQTEKDWGLAWAFGTSKATPSDTFPPSDTSQSFQTLQLPGGQAFKLMSLVGRSHSNHRIQLHLLLTQIPHGNRVKAS